MVKADKARLRKELLARRRALAAPDHRTRSEAICGHVLERIRRQKPAVVCLFAAVNGEPDLLSLVGRSPAPLALPRITGKNTMEFREFKAVADLEPGPLGIPQPPADQRHRLVRPGPPLMVLVPAVAIDRQGGRLGYGGGFYDLFLREAAESPMDSPGVVFDEFFVDAVPTEPHDIHLPGVLTETGYHRIGD